MSRRTWSPTTPAKPTSRHGTGTHTSHPHPLYLGVYKLPSTVGRKRGLRPPLATSSDSSRGSREVLLVFTGGSEGTVAGPVSRVVHSGVDVGKEGPASPRPPTTHVRSRVGTTHRGGGTTRGTGSRRGTTDSGVSETLEPLWYTENRTTGTRVPTSSSTQTLQTQTRSDGVP